MVRLIYCGVSEVLALYQQCMKCVKWHQRWILPTEWGTSDSSKICSFQLFHFRS